MRRLRLVMGVVAVALFVPAALLVQRALSSAAAERRAERRTAAELVFADMERLLADFVQREDARPFEQYRHLYQPTGQVAGSLSLTVSPLAGEPEEPHVVGYFQVDPDGTLRTPIRPTPAEAGSGRTPTSALAERDDRVRRLAMRWLAGPSKGRVRAEEETTLQAPGTTLPVGRAAERASTAGVSSAQEVLGAVTRARTNLPQRQSKAGWSPAPNVSPGERFAERLDVLQKKEARRALSDEDLDRLVDDAAQTVRVVVDPLSGVLLDDRHLLLHRIVLAGGLVLRQGVLVDAVELGRWLEHRALAGSTAARTAWSTSPPGDGGGTGQGTATFRHRFSPPVDVLWLTLALPDEGAAAGTQAIAALALLLLVTGTAGLWAVHRMASVTVAYAQRRSDFVSAVTHELKTPLAAIRMHGEMLRDGLVASEAKRDQYHRTITAECERLSRLVDNVLELARLERGTRPLSLVTGPVEPVLREAVEILEPHARSRGFRLVAETAAGASPATFDRDALLQVVLNLVDNALKYARDGEPKEVVVRAEGREGGVTLTVRDHGPGISPAQLGRVFEPFHRGEPELTRRAPGTGIGLALVRGLVERMGGSVAARNATGGGLEVAVTLPAASG